jgi:REP element-mobilizing transposase RayT
LWIFLIVQSGLGPDLYWLRFVLDILLQTNHKNHGQAVAEHNIQTGEVTMKKNWAREKQQVYFITNTIVGWKTIFVTTRSINIIVESWRFFIERRGAQFLAYIVMPSHLHYIVHLVNADYGISDMQRDFKRHTARQMIEGLEASLEKPPSPALPLFEAAGFRRESAKELLAHFREAGRIANQTYRIWLPDDQPEMVFTQKFFEQTLQYLHANPVEAKIATVMEDYPYSSAAFYSAGKEGLIPISPMRFLE